MPCPAEIRRVHESLPIGGELRTRLPRSFLVVNLASPSLSSHAPEATGSVQVSPIRDKPQLRSIGRPCRADLVVEAAVVITRQGASVLAGYTLNVAQGAVLKTSSKDVEVPVVCRRDESDARPVGGKTRLDTDRIVLHQSVCLLCSQLVDPERNR